MNIPRCLLPCRLSLLLGIAACGATLPGAAAQAAGPAPAPAQAANNAAKKAGPDALLRRMAGRYRGHAYRAKFAQMYQDAASGARPTETGLLEVDGQARVRFAYDGAEQKLFVFDGEDAYFAEPTAAQVTKVSGFGAGVAGEALSFLWGGGASLPSFAASACTEGCPFAGSGHGPGEVAITFRPKRNLVAVQRVDLLLDGPSAEVVEVRLQDGVGNVTRYLLTERQFDVKLPAAHFRYQPPADFSVVEAAAEGA